MKARIGGRSRSGAACTEIGAPISDRATSEPITRRSVEHRGLLVGRGGYVDAIGATGEDLERVGFTN